MKMFAPEKQIEDERNTVRVRNRVETTWGCLLQRGKKERKKERKNETMNFCVYYWIFVQKYKKEAG